MCHAILKNGETITDPEKILCEQHAFYTDLYTSNEHVEFTLQNDTTTKVPADLCTEMEKSITAKELEQVVKSMKKGRSPGPDGLPADFYQMFWPELQGIMTDMYNEVFAQEKIIPSAMQGILNLIPKQNKDTRVLKNLRPITLLNTDYKMVEKLLATRMAPAM